MKYYDKEGQCLNKFPYKTISLAQRIVRTRKGKLEAYYCPHCSFYHIGNIVPKLKGGK